MILLILLDIFIRVWYDVGGFASTVLIIPSWKVEVMTLRQEKAEMRGVLTHMRAFHSILTTTDRISTATLSLGGSLDSGFIIAFKSVFP